MSGFELPPIKVAAAEPIEGDDFYLIDERSGAVCAWRGGKAVVLHGTELARARRWVVEREERESRAASLHQRKT